MATYGNGDGRWATTTRTGGETTMRGAATTTKAAGLLPPPPPPVAITSGPDPSSQYGTVDPPPPERRTTCPSLLSPCHLLSTFAFRLSFVSRSLRWLVVTSPFVGSPFVASPSSSCIARRNFPFTQCIAPSPLPLLHCRRAVHRRRRCVAFMPSIAPVAS